MAIGFTLTARAPIPATQAWERLIDLGGHTRVVPLTRITPAGATICAGLGFVAKTSLGPFSFDDVMEVLTADAPAKLRPGHLVIDKQVLGLTGTIEVTVEQTATGARVTWRHMLDGGGLTALLHPLINPLVCTGYGLALRRILGPGTRIRAAHRRRRSIGPDPHITEGFPESDEESLP